jgi:hypothetical protein
MKFKNSVLVFIGLWLLLFPLVADPVLDGVLDLTEYAGSAVFNDGAITVAWTIGADVSSFAVAARTTGWVGLGFGAEGMMQDADMAIGWVDDQGRAFVLDCFSLGPYGPHPPDSELGGSNDILAYAASERDGITTIEFRRPTLASDAYDKPVRSGDAFLWAYGLSDDFDEYHPFAGVGILDGAGNAVVPKGGASVAVLLFVLPHALPLLVSFLLMSAGMLVARYGKKNRRWLAIHKPLGASGALLGIIGLGFGIRMVSMTTGLHFRVFHAFIGAAALVLAMAAPVLGQAMFKARSNKAGFRKAHRLVGRLAILLMGVTILSGLIQAGLIRLPF